MSYIMLCVTAFDFLWGYTVALNLMHDIIEMIYIYIYLTVFAVVRL